MVSVCCLGRSSVAYTLHTDVWFERLIMSKKYQCWQLATYMLAWYNHLQLLDLLVKFLGSGSWSPANTSLFGTHISRPLGRKEQVTLTQYNIPLPPISPHSSPPLLENPLQHNIIWTMHDQIKPHNFRHCASSLHGLSYLFSSQVLVGPACEHLRGATVLLGLEFLLYQYITRVLSTGG